MVPPADTNTTQQHYNEHTQVHKTNHTTLNTPMAAATRALVTLANQSLRAPFSEELQGLYSPLEVLKSIQRQGKTRFTHGEPLCFMANHAVLTARFVPEVVNSCLTREAVEAVAAVAGSGGGGGSSASASGGGLLPLSLPLSMCPPAVLLYCQEPVYKKTQTCANTWSFFNPYKYTYDFRGLWRGPHPLNGNAAGLKAVCEAVRACTTYVCLTLQDHEEDVTADVQVLELTPEQAELVYGWRLNPGMYAEGSNLGQIARSTIQGLFDDKELRLQDAALDTAALRDFFSEVDGILKGDKHKRAFVHANAARASIQNGELLPAAAAAAVTPSSWKPLLLEKGKTRAFPAASTFFRFRNSAPTKESATLLAVSLVERSRNPPRIPRASVQEATRTKATTPWALESSIFQDPVIEKTWAYTAQLTPIALQLLSGTIGIGEEEKEEPLPGEPEAASAAIELLEEEQQPEEQQPESPIPSLKRSRAEEESDGERSDCGSESSASSVSSEEIMVPAPKRSRKRAASSSSKPIAAKPQSKSKPQGKAHVQERVRASLVQAQALAAYTEVTPSSIKLKLAARLSPHRSLCSSLPPLLPLEPVFLGSKHMSPAFYKPSDKTAGLSVGSLPVELSATLDFSEVDAALQLATSSPRMATDPWLELLSVAAAAAPPTLDVTCAFLQQEAEVKGIIQRLLALKVLDNPSFQKDVRLMASPCPASHGTRVRIQALIRGCCCSVDAARLV